MRFFLVKAKKTPNLIPVKKVVTKKGKVFSQTYYIAPEKAKRIDSNWIDRAIEYLSTNTNLNASQVEFVKKWILKNRHNALEMDSFRYVLNKIKETKTPKWPVHLINTILHNDSIFAMFSYTDTEIGDKIQDVFGDYAGSIQMQSGINLLDFFSQGKHSIKEVEKDIMNFKQVLIDLFTRKKVLQDHFFAKEVLIESLKEIKDKDLPKDKETLIRLMDKISEKLDFNTKFFDIGDRKISYNDVDALHDWSSNFYIDIRKEIKEYDAGKKSKENLSTNAKTLLDFVEPLSYPILFRGTMNSKKWKKVSIGSKIRLGVASFTLEPEVARKFSFPGNDPINTVLIYVNQNNNLTGVDLQKIRTKIWQNFSQLESYPSIIKALFKDFVFRFSSEREVVVRSKYVKVIDVLDDVFEVKNKYNIEDVSFAPTFVNPNRKIRFIVLTGS